MHELLPAPPAAWCLLPGRMHGSRCACSPARLLIAGVCGLPSILACMQTETPDALKAFNDSAAKGGKRKVVRREAVAVLSQGTLTEPSMVAVSPHATYAATAVEVPVEGERAGEGEVVVGVCAIEAAQGRVLLGQFRDGPLRATLQRCFTGAACSSSARPDCVNTLQRFVAVRRGCHTACKVARGAGHTDKHVHCLQSSRSKRS
jgi:hypothetical protein